MHTASLGCASDQVVGLRTRVSRCSFFSLSQNTKFPLMTLAIVH